MAREGILLDVRAVTKNYGGLRPLRIERLTVLAGQHVALVGLDQPMAEVFINLVTGATLPDTGEIVLFGRATGAIHTSDDWLSIGMKRLPMQRGHSHTDILARRDARCQPRVKP